MSGYGYLEFLSSLRGGDSLPRAVAIAEKIMKLDLDRKVRAYSTGMKQKLSLAMAFSEPVEILILDEPTSALDPSARLDVLELVKAAKARGQTVIFSGHVLSEVEKVCDRVAIMRRGRLMKVEDLHTRRCLRMLLIRFPHRDRVEFPPELEASIRTHDGDVVLAEHRGPILPMLDWLRSQGIVDLAVGTEDLHSLYDEYHGPNAVEDVESIPLMGQ
jgi:ABC-2 type transport system ATP-binding protein